MRVHTWLGVRDMQRLLSAPEFDLSLPITWSFDYEHIGMNQSVVRPK